MRNPSLLEFFFFKQKTAYEIVAVTGVQTCALPIFYRLQTSCVGHGFFWTTNKGCGNTADGTGFNQNEAQTGAAHCDLDCSGVRDADWDKHADQDRKSVA